jgi:hypothetical protein
VVCIRVPAHGSPFETVRCLNEGWSTVMRTRRRRRPTWCRASPRLLR